MVKNKSDRADAPLAKHIGDTVTDHYPAWGLHRLGGGGYPRWISRHYVTPYDKRTEQLFIDTRNALCSVEAFRLEISHSRQELSADPDSADIERVAEDVCRTWKIHNGKQWVVWLLEHWDPATGKYPPLSPPPPSDSFTPWGITLDYRKETDEGPEVCLRATITMNAGVSIRHAQPVVEFAAKAMDASKVRIGRPGLTDRQREMLREKFSQLWRPDQKQKVVINKVRKACIESGEGDFSEALIGEELREWRREKGHPVRRFVPDK